MENENIFYCGADLIYLAACALHGKVPDRECIKRMELAEVYKQAARHSMQAITYEALSQYLMANGKDGVELDPAILSSWQKAHLRAVRHTVKFDLEREKVTSFLEEKNIWYAHLKGLILQNYYPKLGMRQMCDNDILYDPAYRQELIEFMESIGYTYKNPNSPYPDTFLKDNFNFEMHRTLYIDSEDMKVFSDYYADVKSRLVKDGTTENKFRFTDEDFYVHSVTHAYKHFICGGNGIRSLMDTYVYLKKMDGRLDSEYIEGELKKLGIYEFDCMTRRISKVLFSEDCVNIRDMGETLSEDDVAMIKYYVDSGVYGTMKHSVERKLNVLREKNGAKGGNKFKYFLRRIFPNMEYYRLCHPVAYKHKILIPAIWLWRIVVRFAANPKKHLREFMTLIKTK